MCFIAIEEIPVRMMKGCIYCPRCEKAIPKDQIEERSRQLAAMTGNDSLSKGRCPVCGTSMIDVDRVKRKE